MALNQSWQNKQNNKISIHNNVIHNCTMDCTLLSLALNVTHNCKLDCILLILVLTSKLLIEIIS